MALAALAHRPRGPSGRRPDENRRRSTRRTTRRLTLRSRRNARTRRMNASPRRGGCRSRSVVLADAAAVAASLRAKAARRGRREDENEIEPTLSRVDGSALRRPRPPAVAATDAAKSSAVAVPASTLGLAFGTWTRVDDDGDGDGLNATGARRCVFATADGEPSDSSQGSRAKTKRRERGRRRHRTTRRVRRAREGDSTDGMGDDHERARTARARRSSRRCLAFRGDGTDGTGRDVGTPLPPRERGRGRDGDGNGDGDDGPPPAAAMFVSLDATVTALRGERRGGGGARLRCSIFGRNAR